MEAERAIHVIIFFLLLVGLAVFSAWASYAYLQNNLILVFAAIPLCWGIILLALYLSFKKLEWTWWN